MMRAGPPTTTFALLHLLCRPELPDNASERLAAMGDGHLGAVNWVTICARLRHYGGSSWALAHVRKLGLAVPTQQLTTLRIAARAEVGRALISIQITHSLGRLLHGPSSDALLLKGRAIEARAYPADILRPSNDVDLLARPGRRAAIETWLRDAGWRTALTVGDQHATLWHGPGGVGAVDLHDAPVSPTRFSGLTTTRVAQLFDRAIEVHEPAPRRSPVGQAKTQRAGVNTLDLDDHTALLIAHLHAGVFTDLRHLADLGRWLAVVDPDPAEVERILTGWGGRRCFAAGLWALHRWDPTALPARWRHYATPRFRSDKLWQIALNQAWRTSENDLLEPQLWLRRVALLTHLDRPLHYGRSRLRAAMRSQTS